MHDLVSGKGMKYAWIGKGEWHVQHCPVAGLCHSASCTWLHMKRQQAKLRQISTLAKVCEKRLSLEGNKSVGHFYYICHWAKTCCPSPSLKSSTSFWFFSPLLPPPFCTPSSVAGQVAAGQTGRCSCCFSYVFSCCAAHSSFSASSAFQPFKWPPPLSLLPSPFQLTFCKFSACCSSSYLEHC